MKKISSAALILSTAFVLYAIKSIVPNIYLNLGKSAYENKDYASAYKNLKTALILNSKNRDVRYYYVETLLNLRPTFEIQKELYKISQTNLPDSADLIADRQVEKWKNTIFLS